MTDVRTTLLWSSASAASLEQIPKSLVSDLSSRDVLRGLQRTTIRSKGIEAKSECQKGPIPASIHEFAVEPAF